MARTFFSIKALDLTPYEDIQNHDVNQTEVYQSWTDGNWKERRVLIRKRIEGSVTLGFSNEESLIDFLYILKNNKQPDGTYNINVFVNNMHTTVTINAFLTISGAGKWDTVNDKQWQTLTVEIMEA